ncbi:ribonuclease P protein component [Campylobacter canadensis]|uniref:Ribonuclease P protein component n=1 Tax=Campylobacter canadensis TaxID=449520 RepID=A0ABS7WSJ9_9BACT|nr:ribonuclease P protein component [Campylobacter canadensis]MBZ7994648.1 ribonuclease P protein component [Campylobacter canadensis]MBZ7996144.1 ribonuclease P protein component [Campylobacter canadensis]MBZ7998070.1 ribonuclease P protein component [Campylobacter canadensis]MBZ8000040.1 ribonuclease P protein component [Campylobacter canadensis]
MNSQKEFNRIYKQNQKWFNKACVVYYDKKQSKTYAVIASKKVGCAVYRNKARRLIKAIFLRLYEQLESGEYVFIIKKELFELSFCELEKNIKWSLKKLGAIKEDKIEKTSNNIN